jgi:hypothetical protein
MGRAYGKCRLKHMSETVLFHSRANFGNQPLGGGRLGRYMDDARDCVIKAHAILTHDLRRNEVGPYFQKYFFTELQPGKALNDVLDRILLTMNGLNNEIRVGVSKILPSPPNSMNSQEGQAIVLPSTSRGSLKQGENDRLNLATEKMERMGHIYMTEDLVDVTAQLMKTGYKPVPVKTLIHEATHKFAGTIDYWYFSVSDGDLPGDAGDHAPGTKKFGDAAVVLGKQEKLPGDVLARMNADSFGWFCYKVGSSNLTFKERKIRGKELSRARGKGGMIG